MKENTKSSFTLSEKVRSCFAWLISAVIDKWKGAIVVFVSSLGIAIFTDLKMIIINHFDVYEHSITDNEKLIKIMRRTDIGNRLLYIIPYYDTAFKKQYAAVAYQDKETYVNLYEISGNTPVKYNVKLPINQEYPVIYNAVSPGVYFPQGFFISNQKNIVPTLVSSVNEFDADRVDNAKLYASVLNSYFGFTKVEGYQNVMLYTLYLESSVRGRNIRMFLYDPKKNKTYQIYQMLWYGLESEEPILSSNVDNDGVRDWLLNELNELKLNWVPPYDEEEADFYLKAKNSDAAKWFDANGINATTGNIVTIPYSEESVSYDKEASPEGIIMPGAYAESSFCKIKVDDIIYFINYRVGVDAYDITNKKYYILYRGSQITDGPWKLIEGTNYIWVDFVLKRDANDKNIFRVLGFDKHSNIDLVEFISADYKTIESDRQGLMEYYGDDYDFESKAQYNKKSFDLNLNMNIPDDGGTKEGNIDLEYENKTLTINGLDVLGVEGVLRTRNGPSISLGEEFTNPTVCGDDH